MTDAKQWAGCTIVSPNYLPFARTLAGSYVEQHPGQRFFVLIVADLSHATPFQGEAYTPVMLGEIGLADLRGEAMKYNILELNTNVKPTFMKYLLAQHGLAGLVYLDPDIFCYAPLAPVFRALETKDAVLTPHITSPVFDGKKPGEQDLLVNGTYNLGFIAVKASGEGLRLLNWWERRCLDVGYSEGRTGLFVDQKWMNLAPGLFGGVEILRHAGCNMAYWNLHERSLLGGSRMLGVEGEVELCFFHFSGVVVEDAAVLSKHTNRFTLAERPDLQEIFAAYKAAVLRNKRPSVDGLPYGFDAFSDGTAVTALARRLYSVHQERFPGDPFAASGAWARYAAKHRLTAGKVLPHKASWSEFSGTDRRVEAVHRLLRLALRVLGPNRYELLMRYLGHISVLRNQSVFLDRDLP